MNATTYFETIRNAEVSANNTTTLYLSTFLNKGITDPKAVIKAFVEELISSQAPMFSVFKSMTVEAIIGAAKNKSRRPIGSGNDLTFTVVNRLYCAAYQRTLKPKTQATDTSNQDPEKPKTQAITSNQDPEKPGLAETVTYLTTFHTDNAEWKLLMDAILKKHAELI